uniref:Uncharacterized protein n=1 Tax=Trypanosoma vivax (strain Y486) TaxID=1055687 RepID=G0U905_TRYVY|nr:hypothetical protein, unlikely [Trypanosoma vivax Y486]
MGARGKGMRVLSASEDAHHPLLSPLLSSTQPHSLPPSPPPPLSSSSTLNPTSYVCPPGTCHPGFTPVLLVSCVAEINISASCLTSCSYAQFLFFTFYLTPRLLSHLHHYHFKTFESIATRKSGNPQRSSKCGSWLLDAVPGINKISVKSKKEKNK